MTWLDNFMEKAKTPAIGTPEWFQCIPVTERDVARRLVSEFIPVGVIQTSGGVWKVVFDETEFAAGAFSDPQAAVDFSADWNKNIADTH